jgi:hypothetical protein
MHLDTTETKHGTILRKRTKDNDNNTNNRKGQIYERP